MTPAVTTLRKFTSLQKNDSGVVSGPSKANQHRVGNETQSGRQKDLHRKARRNSGQSFWVLTLRRMQFVGDCTLNRQRLVCLQLDICISRRIGILVTSTNYLLSGSYTRWLQGSVSAFGKLFLVGLTKLWIAVFMVMPRSVGSCIWG